MLPLSMGGEGSMLNALPAHAVSAQPPPPTPPTTSSDDTAHFGAGNEAPFGPSLPNRSKHNETTAAAALALLTTTAAFATELPDCNTNGVRATLQRVTNATTITQNIRSNDPDNLRFCKSEILAAVKPVQQQGHQKR